MSQNNGPISRLVNQSINSVVKPKKAAPPRMAPTAADYLLGRAQVPQPPAQAPNPIANQQRQNAQAVRRMSPGIDRVANPSNERRVQIRANTPGTPENTRELVRRQVAAFPIDGEMRAEVEALVDSALFIRTTYLDPETGMRRRVSPLASQNAIRQTGLLDPSDAMEVVALAKTPEGRLLLKTEVEQFRAQRGRGQAQAKELEALARPGNVDPNIAGIGAVIDAATMSPIGRAVSDVIQNDPANIAGALGAGEALVEVSQKVGPLQPLLQPLRMLGVDPEAIERGIRQFGQAQVRGFAGGVSSMTRIPQLLGSKEWADLSDAIDKGIAMRDADKPLDDTFFNEIGRTIGGVIPQIAPALLTGGSSIGASVAGRMAASAVFGMTEAATNAAGGFDRAVKEGQNIEEARQRAFRAMPVDAIVSSVLNKLGAFGELSPAWKKMFASSFTEGLQETFQTGLEGYVATGELDFTSPEAIKGGLLGMILGPLMGGGIDLATGTQMEGGAEVVPQRSAAASVPPVAPPVAPVTNAEPQINPSVLSQFLAMNTPQGAMPDFPRTAPAEMPRQQEAPQAQPQQSEPWQLSQAALKPRRVTKAQMIERGADGFLSSAVQLDIPVSKIDGREPVPEMEGGYQPGTPITQPIEVAYDPDSDTYILYSGNHRVRQAEINGQATIPAFVEGFDHKAAVLSAYQEGKPVPADVLAEYGLSPQPSQQSAPAGMPQPAQAQQAQALTQPAAQEVTPKEPWSNYRQERGPKDEYERITNERLGTPDLKKVVINTPDGSILGSKYTEDGRVVFNTSWVDAGGEKTGRGTALLAGLIDNEIGVGGIYRALAPSHTMQALLNRFVREGVLEKVPPYTKPGSSFNYAHDYIVVRKASDALAKNYPDLAAKYQPQPAEPQMPTREQVAAMNVQPPASVPDAPSLRKAAEGVARPAQAEIPPQPTEFVQPKEVTGRFEPVPENVARDIASRVVTKKSTFDIAKGEGRATVSGVIFTHPDDPTLAFGVYKDGPSRYGVSELSTGRYAAQGSTANDAILALSRVPLARIQAVVGREVTDAGTPEALQAKARELEQAESEKTDGWKAARAKIRQDHLDSLPTDEAKSLAKDRFAQTDFAREATIPSIRTWIDNASESDIAKFLTGTKATAETLTGVKFSSAKSFARNKEYEDAKAYARALWAETRGKFGRYFEVSESDIRPYNFAKDERQMLSSEPIDGHEWWSNTHVATRGVPKGANATADKTPNMKRVIPNPGAERVTVVGHVIDSASGVNHPFTVMSNGARFNSAYFMGLMKHNPNVAYFEQADISRTLAAYDSNGNAIWLTMPFQQDADMVEFLKAKRSTAQSQKATPQPAQAAQSQESARPQPASTPKPKLTGEDLARAKAKKYLEADSGKGGTNQQYADSLIEEGYRARQVEVVNEAAVRKAKAIMDKAQGRSILSASRAEDDARKVIKDPPKKTEYRAQMSSGTYRVISKTLYDYMLKKAGPYKDEPKPAPAQEFSQKAKDLPDAPFENLTEAEIEAVASDARKEAVAYAKSLSDDYSASDVREYEERQFPRLTSYRKAIGDKTHAGYLKSMLESGKSVPDRVLLAQAELLERRADNANTNTKDQYTNESNARYAQKLRDLAAYFRSATQPAQKAPAKAPESVSPGVQQAEGSTAGVAQKYKPIHHVAVYSGKAVMLDGTKPKNEEFRSAAMRVYDNAGEGFVIAPDGSVWAITKSSRKAKPASAKEASEAVAIAKKTFGEQASGTKASSTAGVANAVAAEIDEWASKAKPASASKGVTPGKTMVSKDGRYWTDTFIGMIIPQGRKLLAPMEPTHTSKDLDFDRVMGYGPEAGEGMELQRLGEMNGKAIYDGGRLWVLDRHKIALVEKYHGNVTLRAHVTHRDAISAFNSKGQKVAVIASGNSAPQDFPGTDWLSVANVLRARVAERGVKATASVKAGVADPTAQKQPKPRTQAQQRADASVSKKSEFPVQETTAKPETSKRKKSFGEAVTAMLGGDIYGNRAKAGGEVGINDKWYKGGQFLPISLKGLEESVAKAKRKASGGDRGVEVFGRAYRKLSPTEIPIVEMLGDQYGFRVGAHYGPEFDEGYRPASPPTRPDGKQDRKRIDELKAQKLGRWRKDEQTDQWVWEQRESTKGTVRMVENKGFLSQAGFDADDRAPLREWMPVLEKAIADFDATGNTDGFVIDAAQYPQFVTINNAFRAIEAGVPLTPEMQKVFVEWLGSLPENQRNAFGMLAEQYGVTVPRASGKINLSDLAPKKPTAQSPAEPKVVGGTKQPWQMTQREWNEALDALRPDPNGEYGNRMGGMGRATTEQSFKAQAQFIESEKQRLRMGLPPKYVVYAEDGSPTVVSERPAPTKGQLIDDWQELSVSHRDVVEEALKRGLPVPLEVLADYPDLAAQQATPQSPDILASPRRVQRGMAPEPTVVNKGNVQAKTQGPTGATPIAWKIVPIPHNGPTIYLDQLTELGVKAFGQGIVGTSATGTKGAFVLTSGTLYVKKSNDHITYAHEGAHRLDQQYKITDALIGSPAHAELDSGHFDHTVPANASAAVKMKEQFAAFMEAYVSDPNTLNTVAPNMVKAFEASVPKETVEAIRKFSGGLRRYAGQDPEAKVKGSFLAPTTPKTFVQMAADNVQGLVTDENLDAAAREVFDEYAPFVRTVDRMVGRGDMDAGRAKRKGERGITDNPNDLEVALREVPYTEQMLEDAIRKGMLNRLVAVKTGKTTRTTKSLLAILEPFGVRGKNQDVFMENWRDFEAYIASMRHLDFARRQTKIAAENVKNYKGVLAERLKQKKAAAKMRADSDLQAELLRIARDPSLTNAQRKAKERVLVDAHKARVARAYMRLEAGAKGALTTYTKHQNAEAKRRGEQSGIAVPYGVPGVGSTIQVANETIKRLQQDKKKWARLKQAEKDLREFSFTMIDNLEWAGILAPEQAQSIKDNNPYWFAIQRVEDPVTEPTITDLLHYGQSGLQAKNPVHALVGSSKSKQDVISALVGRVALTIDSAARNRVAQVTANWLNANGLPDGTDGEIIRVRKSDGIDATTPNTFKFYDHGQEVVWQVHPKNAALIDSLNRVGSLQSDKLDRALVDAVASATSMLHTFIVTAPPFILRNLWRDTFHRISMVGGNPLDTFLPKDKRGKEFKDAFGMGLGRSTVLTNRETYERNQREVMKELTQQGNVIYQIGRGYHALQAKAEEANRLVVYKDAYKKFRAMGRTEYEADLLAFYAAREGMVDFKKGGVTARKVSRFIPFFNAAIAGQRTTGTQLRNNPGKVAVRMMEIAVVGIALEQAFAAMGGDDEEKRLAGLSPYQREMFWNFRIGGDEGFWLSIPKGHEQAVGISMVERMHEVARGREVKAGRTMTTLRDNTLPVSRFEDALGGWKALFEIGFNRSLYNMKTIVPDYERGLAMDARKGTQYASPVGQGMAGVFRFGDPRQWDHAIENMTGYYGRIVTELSEAKTLDEYIRASSRLTGLTMPGSPSQNEDVIAVDNLLSSIGVRPPGWDALKDSFYDAPDEASRQRAARRLIDTAGQWRKRLEPIMERNPNVRKDVAKQYLEAVGGYN